MDTTKHLVTYDWLNKHRTNKGAWTRVQIKALGLEWPLTSGWKQDVIGSLISSEQAREFEKGSTKHAPLKSIKYKRILESLDNLHPDQLRNIARRIDRILNETKP